MARDMSSDISREDKDAILAMGHLLEADATQYDRVVAYYKSIIGEENLADKELMKKFLIPASQKAVKAARESGVTFTAAEQVANALIMAAPVPANKEKGEYHGLQ
jgi:hypothetical protein